MKRIKLSDTKWFMLLLLMCVPIISSCSKEDLPAYEEAEITKVGAYHRFYSGDKDAITGENIVAEKELDRTNNIDSEHGVATAVFTIPAAGGKFTEAERAKVSLSNLVVYVNVSTAARVTPLDGSPKIGVPADWTREHKYSVMAADGTKKIWTVKVTLNK